MDLTKVRELVVDALESMPDDNIVVVYNNFAEENNYPRVYPMADLDEIVGNGLTPTQLIQRLDPDFSLEDDYFSYDDNNIICSGDGSNMVESQTSLDALADWVVDNEKYYAFPVAFGDVTDYVGFEAGAEVD